MFFIDKMKSLFYNKKNIEFGSNGIKDDRVYKLLSDLWQYDLALSIVSSLLSNILIGTEWKTYKNKEKITGEEWYRLNFSPNKRESSSEFYAKLADKLIHERQALIVELASGDLYVADEWSFASGREEITKMNYFNNVRIEDFFLQRQFKENHNCIFLKLPRIGNVNKVFERMSYDFKQLMELTNTAAEKAMGTKYNLAIDVLRTKFQQEYAEEIQKRFEPLMKKPNATFVTTKGEALTDLTEKQRGSEVELVLEAVNNNININSEIICNVGRAFCIPKQFMLSEYTQENEDVYSFLITMFAKPIITMISKKFTLFMIDKESIIKGSQIKANLDTVQFSNTLNLANAVDKLISSSAYTVNEVREKIGDDPIEGGDERILTKNYAGMNEIEKGGGDNNGN